MKKNAGFTLMEVLIAMVLLAGVGAMTLSAFTSAARARVTRPDAGVAYNFGRGLMEQMNEFVRQDQWSSSGLPLSTTSPGTAGPFRPQGSTTTLNGKTYTARYTVTPQDANSDSLEDFRKVKMTVSW